MLIRSIVTLLCGRAATTVLATVFACFVPLADFGNFAAILSASILSAALLDLGLPGAAALAVHREGTMGRSWLWRFFLRQGRLSAFVVSLFLGGVAASHLWPGWADFAPPWSAVCATTALSLIQAANRSLAKLLESLHETSRMANVTAWSNWVPWACALLVMFGGYGLWSWVVAYAAGALACFIIGLLSLVSKLPRSDDGPNAESTTALAPPCFMLNAGFVVFSELDVVVLLLCVNSEAAGVYALVIRFVQVGLLPAQMCGSFLAPRLPRLAATDARGMLQNSVSLSMVLFLVPPCAAQLLGLVLPPTLAQACLVLALLAPLLVARAAGSIASPALDYLGGVHTRARATFFAAGGSVILAIGGTSLLGMPGLVVAHVLAYMPLVASNFRQAEHRIASAGAGLPLYAFALSIAVSATAWGMSAMPTGVFVTVPVMLFAVWTAIRHFRAFRQRLRNIPASGSLTSPD